jgi:SAM-dependent methyltransferase
MTISGKKDNPMPDIFADYSEYYDLLYEDKPYLEEALFVAGLLKQYAPETEPVRTILDLACGTGRHCFELEAMGYTVEGSDIAEPMILRAKKAAAERGSSVVFHNRSFQEADKIGRRYDAVISMFSAIDYLNSHDDLMVSLLNISGLLSPGGLFVFDYWNGNAVIKDFSPTRTLRKERAGLEIVRNSTTQLDIVQQIAKVNFHFICLADGEKKHEFTEEHKIRYFFFREIETYLELCGFELLHRSDFLSETFSPDSWNIAIVARKKAE